MLYRLSYVGSGAARGKIGCEHEPLPNARLTERLVMRSLLHRAKNPVPTISSRKRVAGSANQGIY